MSDARAPRFRPGQFILTIKAEAASRSNPFGLAVPVLELLAMLRREHGMVRITPLWPVGTGVLAFSGAAKLLAFLPVNIQAVVKELLAAAPAAPRDSVDPAMADEARLRLRITLPVTEDIDAVMKKIAASPVVASVEAIPMMLASRLEPQSQADMEAAFPPAPVGPNDPPQYRVRPAGHWPVKFINRPDSWDSLALRNIAVLDSGCDESHPGLGAAAVDGPNAQSRRDPYGHGTFVVHTIAGRATEATTKLKLDPKNVSDTPPGVLPKARVWAANVFDPTPVIGEDGEKYFSVDIGLLSFELSRLAKRATARLKEIDVVNLSLGDMNDSKEVKRAIGEVQKAGIIVVAAAGNKPKDAASDMLPIMYPAAYPGVLSVGAIAYGKNEVWNRSNDDLPSDSDRDAPWDVCAPGEWVLSGLPMNDNGLRLRFSGWLSGTSMAAPYVTAAVAVLRHRGIKDRDSLLLALGRMVSDGGYRRLDCRTDQKG